jgi:hypothetical protein
MCKTLFFCLLAMGFFLSCASEDDGGKETSLTDGDSNSDETACADLTVGQTFGPEPLTVNFSVTTNALSGDLKYNWRFGEPHVLNNPQMLPLRILADGDIKGITSAGDGKQYVLFGKTHSIDAQEVLVIIDNTGELIESHVLSEDDYYEGLAFDGQYFWVRKRGDGLFCPCFLEKLDIDGNVLLSIDEGVEAGMMYYTLPIAYLHNHIMITHWDSGIDVYNLNGELVESINYSSEYHFKSFTADGQYLLGSMVDSGDIVIFDPSDGTEENRWILRNGLLEIANTIISSNGNSLFASSHNLFSIFELPTKTVTHTYGWAGLYPVNVSVSDKQGTVCTVSTEIKITCEANSSRCIGKDIFQCSEDGTRYESSRSCGINQTCVGGQCYGGECNTECICQCSCGTAVIRAIQGCLESCDSECTDACMTFCG